MAAVPFSMAAFLAAGGSIGYLKAGSTASLGAGVGEMSAAVAGVQSG
jgi:uncharacterized membrane protein (UPF0136 family)